MSPQPTALSGAALAVELSDVDRAVLDIERRTFRQLGVKFRVIRERTGLSHSAYFVHLNALIDRPAALAYAPMVVNRLRAHRTSAGTVSTEREEGGGGRDDLRIV